MAQNSYNNLPTSNSDFAIGPGNRLPAVAANSYPQSRANLAQGPIGSGIQASSRAGQPLGPSPGGSIRLSQSTQIQYPSTQVLSTQNRLTEYPTAQYPAAETSTAEYPATQTPATEYPGAEYAGAEYAGAQYSGTQYPGTQYPGAQNAETPYPAAQDAAFQYPGATPYAAADYSEQFGVPSPPNQGISEGYSGRPASSSASGWLFETSANNETYLSSPAENASFQGAPIQGELPGGAPIQNGALDGEPAQQYWTNEAPCGPDGCDSRGIPIKGKLASRWFAGLYAIGMTRDQENNIWLSYDTADIRDRVLNSNDARHSYLAGFEARVGRFFGCGTTAVEAVYWGIFPGTEEVDAWATDLAGDLDTILHFDGISYDPGGGAALVSTSFFQAEHHRLQKTYELHNIELNMFESNFTQQCGCANVKLAWLVGVRYVSFDESFLYSTDPIDVVFNGTVEELHYGIETENDLIGFQVGGRVDVCYVPRFSTYFDTKVGLFANRTSQRSRIFGSNGLAVVSDAGSPFLGTALDVRAETTALAMVGEFRSGLDIRFSRCWSATIGYRAVGLTRVALSTDQIPVDFISALDSLSTVNTNGILIAHGAFAGLEFNY